MGEADSGSLTALSSVFQEPFLFDAAVVHVCIYLFITLYRIQLLT